MTKILSIDIGTSSVKAALLDGAYNILSTAKAEYKIHTTNIDWVELDAGDVMGAIVGAVKGLPGAGGAELICFDNFSPSMLLMDENGDALHPIITHLDRRSKKQTQDILNIFGKDRFQAITGIQPFTGGASITSVLWLMENREGAWRAAAQIGHINTYVYKQLTGVWAIDPVNASQTGMYETIAEGGWSGEICDAFGIPEAKLPDIAAAGAVAGGLSKKYAGLMGIAEGTPVALGTNDAAAAQLGAGNRASGGVLNISGSSDMVSILTDTPIINDKYYTRAFCLPGLWQFYVTTAGGFAVDWFREQFCRDLSAREFFDVEFEEAARMCTDEGLIVKCTPYLAGDRQSLEPKQASFSGLTLDATRRQMLAALLLAMHEPMRDVLDICEKFMRLDKTIKLTGGMLSPALNGLKSRLFPGYAFEAYDDCPLIGSARLAVENLGN
ncbi:MAG: FGGY family carbohydrate kinase [Oscillospiraceae bacterium]|nr:FGGY family carbohydrate kinase [Oscillospiraceae bacterium]